MEFKMKHKRIRRAILAIMWPFQRLTNWLRNNLNYAREARGLNRVLYSDINQVDLQELRQMQEKILELSVARNYPKEIQDNWATHTYRIIFTKYWIKDVLDAIPGEPNALDLGVESVASDIWRAEFPHVRWQNTDWDLRFPWNFPETSTDLIVCTELLEHLSDQPNEIFNEGFYKLGLTGLLRESFRALKPGGYFFATTPNVASVFQLKNLLQGDPPWFFTKHVREYTPGEIQAALKNTGFQVVRARDIHCMTVFAAADYGPLFLLLLENGFPTSGRGDDLFILAQKPI